MTNEKICEIILKRETVAILSSPSPQGVHQLNSQERFGKHLEVNQPMKTLEFI